jgi:hypothetical protein
MADVFVGKQESTLSFSGIVLVLDAALVKLALSVFLLLVAIT